jgi:DNA replication protein DnaC
MKSKPETPQEEEQRLSRERLDRQVEERRRKMIERGIEPPERLDAAEKIQTAGELSHAEAKKIHEMCANMERDRLAFRARMMPLIETHPQKLECEFHLGEYQAINLDETLRLSWIIDDPKLGQQLKLAYHPCPLCFQERLVNERHKKWIKMGVPMRVAHATFDNYETDIEPKKDALAKAKKQAKRRTGFAIFCGEYGNGKSHLAAAILKEIGLGIFVTHGELVDELRATYEDGGKEKMIKKYQKTPCFVLDELDEKIKGDDVQPTLYRILAERFDKGLITVLTGNGDLATILRILGPRLEDRMAMNYSVATFTWQSYRRQHREM